MVNTRCALCDGKKSRFIKKQDTNILLTQDQKDFQVTFL